MSVTDILSLHEKWKIPRLVEKAAFHVIVTKMLMSTLPNKSTELKTEGARVSAIF